MTGDRNDPPGLQPGKPLDVSRARQIVHHFVESTAVHSRSRGWLPMIKLDITHIPLVGDPEDRQTLELLLSPDDWANMVLVVAMGVERAELDAAVGVLNRDDDRGTS